MGRWASSQPVRAEFRVPQPLHAAAAPFAAAAVAALAALVASPRVPLLLAVAFILLTAFRALSALHDRSRLRRQADVLLRTGVQVHPQSRLLVWRAAELTGRRNRKALARSLRWIVLELERPALVTPVPVNRRAVRPHLELLQALVDRVAFLERPVAAQGMVLVEELVTDGLASPLYVGGRRADLRTVLGACFDALDRDAGPARADCQRAHGLAVVSGGGR